LSLSILIEKRIISWSASETLSSSISQFNNMLFNSLVAKVRSIIELLDLLHVKMSDSFKSSKSYFSSQLTNSVALIELVILEFYQKWCAFISSQIIVYLAEIIVCKHLFIVLLLLFSNSDFLL